MEPVPQKIAERILDGLYEGRSLLDVCDEPDMPRPRTVSDWKAKDPEFATAYARAREEGAHIHFAKAGKIAKAATPETVQVARLQAEHEYKTAACYCPKVFGQKAQVEHGGQITLDGVIGETLKKHEPPPAES